MASGVFGAIQFVSVMAALSSGVDDIRRSNQQLVDVMLCIASAVSTYDLTTLAVLFGIFVVLALLKVNILIAAIAAPLIVAAIAGFLCIRDNHR